MTDQGARCPQCQISFRVTPPQLRAAEGMVRCGFCLTAFNAHAHPAPLSPRSPADPPPWLRDDEAGQIDVDLDDEQLEAWLHSPPEPSFPPQSRGEVEVDASGTESSVTSPPAASQTPEPPWSPPRPASRRHGSRLVALSGGLVLALQALYFHADLWAEHAPLRPLYQKLCALAPCRLAPERAALPFRIDGVAVRPVAPRGLRLDAMLTNAGPEALPPPAIRIEFANLEGRVVAGRTLQPDQYLEIPRSERLAAGQSLHLVLEVLDPGPDAVSYHITPER